MITRIILLACFSFFSLSYPLSAQQGGGRNRPGEGAAGSDSPRTAVTATETRSHSIQLGGRLEPGTRIIHKIPSDGYVADVLVRIGQYVKKDQPLVRIDRIDDVLQQYKPTIMSSRLNGLVAEINIQEEEEVSRGNPAIEIIDTSPLILKTLVSDKDAFHVSLNERVTGRSNDGTSITGRLKSRSVEPDYETGLFEMIFEFSRPGSTHPGEWIMVDLPVERTEGIFIRRDLIIRRYGAFYLWVVSEEKKLEAREVELGMMYGKDVHIKAGLSDGETYLSRVTGKEREGDILKNTDGME